MIFLYRKKKGIVERKANKLREKKKKTKTTKKQKNQQPGHVFLPAVPDVECHLFTLYDNETNSEESALVTFTYVLGNVCRAI